MIKRYMEARRLRPQKTCATMIDLRGREIRVGKMPDAKGIFYEVGHIAKITHTCFKSELCTDDLIQIDNILVHKILRGGDLINFADGKIIAMVLEVNDDQIKVQFKEAGHITQHSRMQIQGARLQGLPILQDNDILDIQEIALKNKFDYICVPGVSAAKDLQEIKLKFRDSGKLGILAKIDNLEAIH